MPCWPPSTRARWPDANLRRIVDSLPEPAYITGRRFDILTWNAAAIMLFGDFGHIAPKSRNVLHWMLTDPAARQVFGQTWPEEARRVVALFRAAYDLQPGEPPFVALVDRVRTTCPEFEGWWSGHGVGAPLSGAKHLHHPTLGAVRYEYASFQASVGRPSHACSPATPPASLPTGS